MTRDETTEMQLTRHRLDQLDYKNYILDPASINLVNRLLSDLVGASTAAKTFKQNLDLGSYFLI